MTFNMRPFFPNMTTAMTATAQPPPSDEDIEAFALELQQEIRQNPPIRCGLSFHWSGTQEQADQVLIQLMFESAMLRRESPWLDLSSLKSIVFHADYDQGLREAGARVGRDLTATREPGGLSFAMVVHSTDGCELIADANLALGLLSQDATLKDVSVSTLRHELCHVDDFQRKNRLWTDESLPHDVTGLRTHFFPLVESLWSEYYANRVSDGLASDEYLTGEEEMLASASHDAAREIKEAIRAFRGAENIGVLVALAKRKVRFVAMSMGYVLGRYAARGLTTPRSAAVQEALDTTGLQEAFEASRTELDRLFHARASWASTSDLEGLERIWIDVMQGFGLRFAEVSPGRVQVFLPFGNPHP